MQIQNILVEDTLVFCWKVTIGNSSAAKVTGKFFGDSASASAVVPNDTNSNTQSRPPSDGGRQRRHHRTSGRCNGLETPTMTGKRRDGETCQTSGIYCHVARQMDRMKSANSMGKRMMKCFCTHASLIVSFFIVRMLVGSYDCDR